MIDLEDIRIYLPKYLSPETEEKLFADLADFPDNIDDRMYGFEGIEDEIIYQGDGIEDLLIIHLPDKKIAEKPALILSNTCDTEVHNKRIFNSNLVYTPLIKLSKYKHMLLEKNLFTEESIESHISQIKRQRITQVFYLPSGYGVQEECIVFFDKLNSCDSRYIERSKVSDLRLFSLSQYGFYLFLYKLSIHFTRLHEGVDRKY